MKSLEEFVKEKNPNLMEEYNAYKAEEIKKEKEKMKKPRQKSERIKDFGNMNLSLM